ncbi:hypothetical protein [Bacillus sp. 1P02SD]|uniref:hypothetical protein n=1 Tax=Bacillus sp. 1P02SD TaxID=3132264 RepID=UPI0039A01742
MKVTDHLSKRQQEQLEKMTLSLPKRNKAIGKPVTKSKHKEDLSRRDIEDLMGTRRDTFKQVRGAVRRK